MVSISQPAAGDYPADFAGYVAEIGADEDVLAVLAAQLEEMLDKLAGLPPSRGDYRYAAGKWSVKDVVGHLADTERVFALRAVWIARRTPATQPPYDDQAWVAETGAERRSLADMVEEWSHVRRATLALLRPLAPEVWLRGARAGDGSITVRALAYVIAGHTRHHLRVLEVRYLR